MARLLNLRGLFLASAVLAAAALTAHAAPAPADHGVDTPMNADPGVTEVAHPRGFDPRLVGLWSQALDRPEADLRLNALDAVALAHGQGMTGLETLTPKILHLLADDHQPQAIWLSAARALAELDARQAASEMLARDKSGTMEFAAVADASLARWKTTGADELWISRIKDAGKDAASEQLLRSAIESVGVTANAAAADPLKQILAATGRHQSLRLAAAKALASFPPDVTVPDAQRLAISSDAQDHLLAAAMLPAANDPRVIKLLDRLAQDAEPTVVAIAAQKLLTGAPQATAPLAAKLADNHDVAVRRLAVEALHLHANPANIGILARLLNDDAPHVRIAAREALIDIDGKPELRAAVRAAATQALQSSGPYGMEQAALILGTLHENSAGARLVELLDAPQHPVRLAAVVALRRLAIAETLPDQFKRAQAIAENVRKPKSPLPAGEFEGLDIELSQLEQNLAIGRYMAAGTLMMSIVPKHSGLGTEARTAAAWSLGLLHESATDSAVAGALTSRLMDTNIRDPEAGSVRAMSAIGLGRMKDRGAKSALLRVSSDEGGSRLGEASRWAVSQIEGKPFTPGPAEPMPVTGWFLEPAE